jgi:ribulose-phosphate 3-epimerase
VSQSTFNTVKIAPSILSADFSCLATELERLNNAGADWIHVDVMDGMFVPNLTIGPPVIASLRKHSPLPFDVHLMIEKPERYLADFQQAGANIITVHAETCPHLQGTLTRIRELGCRAGVSLNPSTPVNALAHVLDITDLILLMSVNPGFGGQRFIPATLPKIRAVRQLIENHPIDIEVDGGITTENAALVIEAGASVLVAGSAVFNAQNMPEAIQRLRGQ